MEQQDKKAHTIEEEELERVNADAEEHEASDQTDSEEQDENNEEPEIELVNEDDSKVKELEEKIEDLNTRLLRNQADYDNFRRRTRKEKEADAKYRSQKLAEQLLPALDNFERAMMVDISSEDGKSLLQGMEMVYRQIKEALDAEGIKPIEAVGAPFDPHYHQAVMQVESDDYDSNIVVEEMQKGYMLNDRVIRPAMVKVST
ncbi:nucleotide exchange factor GrpE [Alteribacter lacisalsi]|uniref:Protein GrpE n=1 Tax=Alteribacter lacisalsi TaxID=2045244 RepID=A0A2W0HY29_9BACI|nr:nucleotide exchange factor GrpE [Alteribacter lacisalsi]PYZ98698.1 nucleotide exchange factor GrpE [Alteribacter lacisalsi]